MTVTYAVSEHPLLSAKALALAKNEDAFAEQVAFAAELLGVDQTVYVDDQLLSIQRALVLQLNYQLSLSPDVFLYKSTASLQSKQTVVYRGGDSGPPLVLTQALQLVKNVRLQSGWGNIKSVR